MTNASANNCHISRLIGKILELCALFLKCATHRRDTKTSVGSIIGRPGTDRAIRRDVEFGAILFNYFYNQRL
jgi:hypothetical protein